MVAVKAKALVAVACMLLFFSLPAQAMPPAEAEDVVLQLVIDQTEMLEFVEGIKEEEKIYLPLGELSALLDFSIMVDAKKRTAVGWFINESNKLSLTATSAEVRGKHFTIAPDAVRTRENDLFVDSALLQQWLPVDFTADLQRMTLNITTREKLPYQEALWRKKLHDSLLRAQQSQESRKDVKIKTIDQPYLAFQWPSVDLTFSSSYQSADHTVGGDYSALAVGDFGYLTSHLFMSGNLAESALSDLRLKFGRDDYNRNLLGPAKASSFSFGDITSEGLEQVASSGQGRGFTLTSRSLDRPDKFDVTSFIGDSKPGWDVELYRNDTLIGFQTVGSDGRYQFLDIPVLFGNNVFRLSFYGPQGQRDEVVKTINADSGLLEKGEFTYNFSADQKSKTLFGIADASSESSSPRLVGEMEYGVTRRMTAVLGAARTILDGNSHTYATLGLHTSLGLALAAIDGAYDASDSSYSTRLSLAAQVLDTDVQFQQKIAKNFVSDAEGNTADPVTSQTNLTLSRAVDFSFLGGFSNNLILTRKEYESGRLEETVNYLLTKGFMGLNLTNSLQYKHDNLGLSSLDGSITGHGSFNKFQLGTQANYRLNPDKRLDTVKFTLLYPFSGGITDNASLIRTFGDEARTELENTVTLDMQRYKLSLTGRADTRRNYYIGASINTAIGKIPKTGQWVFSSKPMAEGGTIAVRSFLDKNYNQTFDPGEEIFQSAVVRIGGQQPKMNLQSMAVVTQLPVNAPVTISMDQSRQENPYLTSGGEYRVVPRAGKVVMVDFPVFETSQIDGTVYVPAGENPGKMRVDLLDMEEQVINSTHTAFDGYYLLEGISPGSYKVRVADASLAEKNNLKQEDDSPLVIRTTDFYIRDITLVGESAAPAAAPPAPADQPQQAAPPSARPPVIGDAVDIRFANHPDKTRVVLDTTVQIEGKARLENDGKTLTIDLSQVNWRGKESKKMVGKNPIVGYRVEGGNLYIDLSYPVKIKEEKVLLPNKESRNFRLVIDLSERRTEK